MDAKRAAQLADSTDMVPVDASVEIRVPATELWEVFSRPQAWPEWNKCFVAVKNERLELDDQLMWVFGPIEPYYPYVMPAIAKVIELEPGHKVTWEVSALPGFYAHHTYSVEAIDDQRCRFRSWEKAFGWSFRAGKAFWLAHFQFVNQRSLEGAQWLEREYERYGNLLSLTRSTSLTSRLRQTLLTTQAVAAPVWFYDAYVRQSAVTLADGVQAVIGGGGNSLVIEDGGEALLVDSKFPPGSDVLARWVRKYVRSPITKLVNTHYHYDHAQGNELYPEATIIAHQRVPQLMITQEGEYWSRHFRGMPVEAVPDEGATIKVGSTDVVLRYLGVAHTHGDLVVYIPQHDVLVTGDLFFHTYYPFFDLSRAGASVHGLIDAIETLAEDYPSARVVPGHGPVANAEDLRRYADYLRYLTDQMLSCIAQGASEDDAVRTLNLKPWKKSVLPSLHDGRVSWATAETNLRCVYRLLAAQPKATRDPSTRTSNGSGDRSTHATVERRP
ncbi:MAG: MBL fold metallo-hydrolase [Myxococcales bacterium]|nr:MBL fold metallo-hydrolase [Myxococcales bacterium]MDD9970356.1 MBL fold metallo-hydrolase [Myxococcales bacterium]